MVLQSNGAAEVNRYQVFLRTGQIVEFDAESVSITRNGLGQNTKFAWTGGGSSRRLLTIEPSDIVAVVEEELPDDR